MKNMTRSLFLLISAILSFIFGAMMFFVPAVAARFLDIGSAPAVMSVLRGMGGLILAAALSIFSYINKLMQTHLKVF